MAIVCIMCFLATAANISLSNVTFCYGNYNWYIGTFKEVMIIFRGHFFLVFNIDCK